MAEPRPRPTLLGQNHIQQAISDDRFFAALPEFMPLRRKMDAAHASMHSGCSTCRKNRVAQSMSADFVSILGTLSPDAMSRLKRYFGFSRLLVRSLDRAANRVVLREV